MSYKQKYIEYKQKYLTLKHKMIGGVGTNITISPYVYPLNELKQRFEELEKSVACSGLDINQLSNSYYNILDHNSVKKWINVSLDKRIKKPTDKVLGKIRADVAGNHLSKFIMYLQIALSDINTELSKKKITELVSNIDNNAKESAFELFENHYWKYVKEIFEIFDRAYTEFYNNMDKEKCYFIITQLHNRSGTCDKSITENSMQLLILQSLIRVILPISEFIKIYTKLYEGNPVLSTHIPKLEEHLKYIKDIVSKQQKLKFELDSWTSFAMFEKYNLKTNVSGENLAELSNTIRVNIDGIVSEFEREKLNNE